MEIRGNLPAKWIVTMNGVGLPYKITVGYVIMIPPTTVSRIAMVNGVVLQSLTIVKIAFKEIQISQPAFRIAMVNGVVRL